MKIRVLMIAAVVALGASACSQTPTAPNASASARASHDGGAPAPADTTGRGPMVGSGG